MGELVAALPPPAAGPARAVADGLAELAALRHSALAPEDVRALGEVWERFTAQVASARLGVLAAMDARDDVIPKARVGEAGAVFGSHVLGQRRGTARRDALWAGLLRAEVGDLPAVGAAYAAGDITPAHVEVAVRAHKQVGAAAREALVECTTPDPDRDRDGQLRAALAGLSDGFTARVRQIRIVDAMLAHYARRHTVTELEAIAARIVAEVNPPTDKSAHERRYLYMSQLPDGSWVGRFSCGPAQGLVIKRAIAAGSAPRPGTAIDADGVEHPIPDTRDLGARQIDALHDIVTIGLAKSGITLPPDATPTTGSGDSPATGDSTGEDGADSTGTGEDGADSTGTGAATGKGSGSAGEGSGETCDNSEAATDESWDESLDEPPPGEGEAIVTREPGMLAGPYPSVDLVVVAGIEHIAAAWAHRPEGLPINLQENFGGWLRDRFRRRWRPGQEPAQRPAEESPLAESAGQSASEEQPTEEEPGQAPPGESPRADEGIPPGECNCRCDCGRERRDGDPDDPNDTGDPGGPEWLRRALSPYAVPARLEHAGPVDANTLELLACTATIRAAVLAPGGALLDLGRTQRLATPAQKTALLARDGGCIIPGCTVPGDACDAHHIQWWTRGGPTDLENLALVCGRHHTEVHQETWEIHMRDGVPWVTPPTWIDPAQRPLRNAAHHPRNNRGGAR